ncbi:MAG: Cof-type HAD-IIB family hydrolase [Propionibacteriaceae bacterium]|jgi:HAD superfamily hydrolase (TIGR01484 family)|nr:Cof-type HAD-IIB family hydrolase [Propionibacteriaceae bacterium]
MSWQPRLVALDIDGTIADEAGFVPFPLAQKLRQIARAGIPVILVTGRAWLSSQLVLDQLGLATQYCVCNNGATIVTYPPAQVVREQTFDPASLMAVLSQHPTAWAAVEDFGRGYRVSGPEPPNMTYPLHGQIYIETMAQLASRPVTRIIVRDGFATADEFKALVGRLDLRGLSHSQGANNWLDIGPSRKDWGLAIVAEALGVAQEDILAMGDSYNDVELLAWAGRGVALGEAPDELLAVADAVTEPFGEGGTLLELNRWFPPPLKWVS